LNELKNRVLEKTFEAVGPAMEGQVNEKLIVDMKDYFHILNEEETNLLFTNLDKVYQRVFILEVHTKKLRKKVAQRVKG
jgi:hypothetical protein